MARSVPDARDIAKQLDEIVENPKIEAKLEFLTKKALNLLSALEKLSKKKRENGISELFEQQTKKLKELLAMGADRATVLSYKSNR